ncbi:MAG: TRAP transporter substrate-binding protein [Rhodobacteraceae bacterium]|nr:TRAP transporter substrate-binding protein [Paracoccaceae bacterium]
MTRPVAKSLFAALLCSAMPFAAGAQTVLRFATTLPEQAGIVRDFLQPWAESVTAESNGTLTIEVLNGPTIANARNVFEQVVTGVVDIAWGTHGAMPTPFPRTSVVVLPFEVDNAITGSEALWSLYEQGLLDGEYDLIAPLGLVATPPAGLHSVDPVDTLDDMAGLKVRASDAIAAQVITALGGAPIALTPPELYQGVSQGVVGSVHTPYTGLITFNLQEVTHDHLDVPLGSLPGMIFINRAVYDGLPAEARAALDAHSGLVLSRDFATWFDTFNTSGRNAVLGMEGHRVHELSTEQEAAWRAATAPVTDAWLASTPNGEAILAALRTQLGH